MLNTIVKSEMTHVIEFDNVKNGDLVMQSIVCRMMPRMVNWMKA